LRDLRRRMREEKIVCCEVRSDRMKKQVYLIREKKKESKED
jgi:hypothetical protein